MVDLTAVPNYCYVCSKLATKRLVCQPLEIVPRAARWLCYQHYEVYADKEWAAHEYTLSSALRARRTSE